MIVEGPSSCRRLGFSRWLTFLILCLRWYVLEFQGLPCLGVYVYDIQVSLEFAWPSSWSTSSASASTSVSGVGSLVSTFLWVLLKWYWINCSRWYSERFESLLEGCDWFFFIIECYWFGFTSAFTFHWVLLNRWWSI